MCARDRSAKYSASTTGRNTRNGFVEKIIARYHFRRTPPARVGGREGRPPATPTLAGGFAWTASNFPRSHAAKLVAPGGRQVDQVGEVIVGQLGGAGVANNRHPAGAFELRQPRAALRELGCILRFQIRCYGHVHDDEFDAVVAAPVRELVDVLQVRAGAVLVEKRERGRLLPGGLDAVVADERVPAERACTTGAAAGEVGGVVTGLFGRLLYTASGATSGEERVRSQRGPHADAVPVVVDVRGFGELPFEVVPNHPLGRVRARFRQFHDIARRQEFLGTVRFVAAIVQVARGRPVHEYARWSGARAFDRVVIVARGAAVQPDRVHARERAPAPHRARDHRRINALGNGRAADEHQIARALRATGEARGVIFGRVPVPHRGK